jgi:hypothetical protein
MKYVLILFSIFFSSFATLTSQQIELLVEVQPESGWPYPDWNYQDILVNGAIVHHGRGPYCENRYQTIKRMLLDHYKRPFTVLEIGGNNGYLLFRTLQDFPQSVCVMLDHLKGFSTICEWNTLFNNRVIELKTLTNPKDLQRLAQCEHFDVVIVCNLLHHTKDHWKEWMSALEQLGDHLIIEIPQAYFSNAEAINYYLSNLENCKQIGTHPRRKHNPHDLANMYWHQISKNQLMTSAWNSPVKKTTLINSNFLAKNKHHSNKPWIPGINLQTYLNYKGHYPSRQYVKEQLKKLKATHRHLDETKVILSGKQLHYIGN